MSLNDAPDDWLSAPPVLPTVYPLPPLGSGPTSNFVRSLSFTARLNGVDLKPTSDVSEPYPNPYSPMLGKPEELRAWAVPLELLKDGNNEIEIGMTEGETAEIVFLDLAVE